MQEAQETGARSLDQEGPLEKEMAPNSSTPDWRIPWTEEPGTAHGVVNRQLGLSDYHSLISTDVRFILDKSLG